MTGMATLGPADLLTIGQWLSTAYPVGGFAYSHGLEQAIADGLVHDDATLRDWLHMVLTEGAGRSDAIFLALAYHAPVISAHAPTGAVADAPADGGLSGPMSLADLAEYCAALCPARERLLEATAQGAAFAKVTRDTWGFDLPDMPYPVALGRAAALAGLPVAPLVLLFLQAFLTNQVQAAQRLMKLGQTRAQAVLRDLSPAMAEVAGFAVTATADDLGSAAMGVDIAAMRHESLQPRMFRS